ncbi:acyltransferase family protein [Microbacterium aerolatum]|uniref:Acyltransferase n=1 Tax=Microbacterium aerolatum TaxID=153731 RepID=A0A511AE66_9MICO|nr:acyltransferase [Microbacterium aerolatum]GEK84931.1 acyltransferase [Microbacterium aerolatum]GGB37309.1 acyltransferase [Microbacterium aerolatum]
MFIAHRVRLSNLDYLRGAAALGIMLYHYTSWTFGPSGADTALGRIGIYGVAVFYVLSGLTMFHVYSERLNDGAGIRTFFIRRFFRIFPLLVLVTVVTLILQANWPGWRVLLLNISGLFGFVDWDGYIALGAWSIGNELVFYAFLPLVALSARRRSSFAVCVVAFVSLGAYFAFFGLDPSRPLSEQWGTYVNPLNQAFLFVAGFAIGKLLRDVAIPRRVLLAALVTVVALFILWPTGPEQISLVTGPNRIAFSMLCVLLCAIAYKMMVPLPPTLDRPLSTLGEASYSVYLLHPILFTLTGFLVGGSKAPVLTAVLAIVLTIVASVLCYRLYERPVSNLARRLTPVH